MYKDTHRFIDFEKTRIALFKETADEERKREIHPLKKTDKTADIFSDLHLKSERFPVKPIFGEWE